MTEGQSWQTNALLAPKITGPPLSLKILLPFLLPDANIGTAENRCFSSTLADFELGQIDCWLRALRWRHLNRPPELCEGLQ
jgi:hypothetical protein